MYRLSPVPTQSIHGLTVFHKLYKLFGPGLVPTSRRTTTLGLRSGQNALKSHRCELIFFASADCHSVTLEEWCRRQLTLLLATEDDLGRHDTLFQALELHIWRDRQLRCILVYVSMDSLAIDLVLADILLIHTERSQAEYDEISGLGRRKYANPTNRRHADARFCVRLR